MKNLLFFGLMFLASCSKNNFDKPIAPLELARKQSCDFGLTSFNLIKRPPINLGTNDVILAKPPSGNITSPPAGTGIIYLDFDGERVSGTMWNTKGNINCAPANLSADAMNQIIQRVTNDFSVFKVLVTTDEAIFNASLSKRMRVIITESWEWFGQAGGAAYLNTFVENSDNPCFVFSSLLNYNTKAISEAVSHETGHTLGLSHQSSYDINGVKIAEYNSGQGAGEIGWAPIMGYSYSRNLSLWHNGTSSQGVAAFQDDLFIIKTSLGSITDDYSNSVSDAALLTSPLIAVVNESTDLDFFLLNLISTTTVTLIPYNVGVNNAGANIDLVLKVYDSQGNLLSIIDYLNALNTAIVLAPGSYYVSVGAVSNLNTTTYGMVGKYNISLN